MAESGEERDCDRCGHGWGGHAVVGLRYQPVGDIDDMPVGGVILCPDCRCAMPWTLQHPAVIDSTPLPPAHIIGRLRDHLFGQRA